MNSPVGDSSAGASEHCSARLLGIAVTRAVADKMVIAGTDIESIACV